MFCTSWNTLIEVTPRMDNIDEKVKAVNKLLESYVKQTANVFLTKHSNMRKREFFRDDKHLCKECIPRFAANIKNTLRYVYGRKKFDFKASSSNTHQRESVSPRSHRSRPNQDVNALQELVTGDFLRIFIRTYHFEYF